jgi:hypothetical protein
MLINDTHAFAFIHIPKTAGNTVQRNLLQYAAQAGEDVHIPLPHFNHVCASLVFEKVPRVRDYHVFSFVRNPYDRLISAAYMTLHKTWRKDGGGADFAAVRDLLVGTFGSGAADDAAVTRALEANELFAPQCFYLYDRATRRRLVFDVMRVEQFDACMNSVLLRYGYPSFYDAYNVSNADTRATFRYKAIYDRYPELLGVAHRLYGCDFEAFGYARVAAPGASAGAEAALPPPYDYALLDPARVRVHGQHAAPGQVPPQAHAQAQEMLADAQFYRFGGAATAEDLKDAVEIVDRV